MYAVSLFCLAEVTAAALGRRSGLLPLRCQLFMTALTLCVVDPFEALFPNIIRLVALTALLGGLAFFLFPCVVTFIAVLYCCYVGLVRQNDRGLDFFGVLVVNGDLISLRQGDTDNRRGRERNDDDAINPSFHLFPLSSTSLLQKDVYRQDIFVKVFKKRVVRLSLGLTKE
jgi:hypothetical protein